MAMASEMDKNYLQRIALTLLAGALADDKEILAGLYEEADEDLELSEEALEEAMEHAQFELRAVVAGIQARAQLMEEG